MKVYFLNFNIRIVVWGVKRMYEVV